MQGDITGLIDSVSGQLVAAYTYDAYGMLVAHPINDNQFSVIGSVLMLMALPQAYRGYVFSFVGDELCYYLGSRFYSPRLGRFINADKHFDTGTGVLGTNVYAYCNNNPVMYTDPTGESGTVATIAKILGLGVIPAGANILYVKAYNNMLCVRLFQWSFANRYKEHTYDFSSNRLDTKNWSSFIANKLRKSQVIQAEIKSILKKMGNKKSHKEYYGDSYDKSLSFYNEISPESWTLEVDSDLKWSIGNLGANATFSIYVIKQFRIAGKTHCKVYCTLKKELWDFDKIDDCDNFTDYLVNFGSILEDTIKVTTPFYWEFSVSFVITL